MRTADFDYELPPELIAQEPAARRDASRLLVVERRHGRISHETFPDLVGHLRCGDVLVLNDSRVIPVRLRGFNEQSGGKFEFLLVEEVAVNDWWAMLRPGRRARVGTRIHLAELRGRPTGISSTVIETNAEGHRRVSFTGTSNILQELDRIGEVPLPPYIERSGLDRLEQDRARYQTIYARAEGSVAAPTAGLHFTPELLDQARAKGVDVCFVTLHVGLGTFAPVKTGDIRQHALHEERFEISASTAQTIEAARSRGGRVIAVGTTSVRVLETVSAQHGRIVPTSGRTRIFIYPPYEFRAVDALVTNFHLPRSSLLMLVSAFAAPGRTEGRERMLSIYAEAVRERYRFFSYGDAMLIV